MVIEGGRTDPWNWRNVSRGAVHDGERIGCRSARQLEHPRLVDNTNRGEFSAEGIVSTESPAWCLPSSLLGNQSVRLICRWTREEMSSYLLSLYLSICLSLCLCVHRIDSCLIRDSLFLPPSPPLPIGLRLFDWLISTVIECRVSFFSYLEKALFCFFILVDLYRICITSDDNFQVN